MTTPYWGNQIALSDVDVEIGNWNPAIPQYYQIGLDWVRDNAKQNVGWSTGTISDMNFTHDKAYYANNNQGNCNNANNGNCNCACGNKNCGNCTNCNAINCVNCDTRAYLQPNCNCNCTYNCNVNSVTINCDCDCFVCNCW